jgi:hypothetical protein
MLDNNTMAKYKTKKRHKILHRKLKIEQREPN